MDTTFVTTALTHKPKTHKEKNFLPACKKVIANRHDLCIGLNTKTAEKLNFLERWSASN